MFSFHDGGKSDAGGRMIVTLQKNWLNFNFACDEKDHDWPPGGAREVILRRARGGMPPLACPG